MNDNLMFERSARAWLELGPEKAPDEAVRAALFEIETTPQEHGLPAPWLPGRLARFAPAVGMGMVLAIAVVAPLLLDRGATGQVGGPNATLPGVVAGSPSSSPIASPPASSRPSATVVPFDLSSRFTSTRYGYSIALDPRWTVTPASEVWSLDNIDHAGASADEVAIGVSRLTGASEPLEPGQTLDQWLAGFPEEVGGCMTRSPASWGVVQVGPVAGRLDVMCTGAVAIAEAGGRIYVFSWGIGGYSDLDRMSRDGFTTVLQTVRFDAASVPPASAGPAASRP